MELYHLHLLGNHDNMYKPNKEFIVDPNKFNNRLYNKVYNMNATVESNRYDLMVAYFNYLAIKYGLPAFGDRVNLGEIIEIGMREGFSKEEIANVLNDAKDIILAEWMGVRELAMEDYRVNNCPDKPSRLHSLFACTEEGIPFWKRLIRDNDLDIYRIETDNEPFVTNELLLPDEGLCYGDKVKASRKYFNPKKKDLDMVSNEYLIQGKVRVLKKVDEVRKTR